jgi:predicted dehydrogenase
MTNSNSVSTQLQTRRQFLKQSGAAAGATALGLALSPRALARSAGANERLVFGLVGCGSMGPADMGNFLDLKQSVAAVCDVDSNHLDAAAAQVVKAGQPEPKKYKDFRQLLDRKDIDAVIIGTPDHWHALVFIAACEAGKDIYCEKPISHNFIEAKAMVAAAKRFNPVVQIGTWQRSMKHFQDAIAYVRSGALGQINVCRAWMNFLRPDIGTQTPQTPPPELDWDFWLGPAAPFPYTPNRCHENWRWFYETGGTLVSDWGVHMMDIVFLAMQETDPRTISPAGGKFATHDDRNTPDTLQILYQFPKWNLSWEHRFNNPRGLDGGRDHGAEFIGDNGTLIVDRSGYAYYPQPKDHEGPPPAQWAGSTHWQNFLDCVKSRGKPNSDIESMAKTTMLCHLGNIAFQSGRMLHWDAEKQDIHERHEVKHCLSYERDYRAPWKLKHYA